MITTTEIAMTELGGWIMVLWYTRNLGLFWSMVWFVVFEVAFSGWLYFVLVNKLVTVSV